MAPQTIQFKDITRMKSCFVSRRCRAGKQSCKSVFWRVRFFFASLTWLGKREHTPPCSSAELFFAEKNGGHKEKISVVDMVFPFFLGGFGIHHRRGKLFFEARKVPQKIFFRWWSCTLFSSLLGLQSCGPAAQWKTGRTTKRVGLFYLRLGLFYLRSVVVAYGNLVWSLYLRLKNRFGLFYLRFPPSANWIWSFLLTVPPSRNWFWSFSLTVPPP